MAVGVATKLRMEAGRNPHDEKLIALVGELSTRSELFRQRWASQDVRLHRSGRKRLRHPIVGRLDLDVESLELPAEPGLHLHVHTAPRAHRPPTTWRSWRRGRPPSRHLRPRAKHTTDRATPSAVRGHAWATYCRAGSTDGNRASSKTASLERAFTKGGARPLSPHPEDS
ncbi:hypothetical protein [Streptomyces sp. NPDC059398]|uniref:MmyB family transcriptional regulator n=1 Tax=Streptomyces sp. NPDC059398 TaxID=3346820 RepID=UPI00368390F9